MRSNFVTMGDGTIKLECGCVIEVLDNGKHITISCDEHDIENCESFITPIKKTRMKESREI
jgi:hypothetical protein